jgi:hypothetical protein
MGRGRVNPFWHDWMKTACSRMAVQKDAAAEKANGYLATDELFDIPGHVYHCDLLAATHV